MVAMESMHLFHGAIEMFFSNDALGDQGMEIITRADRLVSYDILSH